MRRLTLAVALWFAVGVSSHAWAGSLDRVVNGENVQVSLTSPFSDFPPGGCVPYRVEIRNDRNVAGTWHLSAEGSANFSSTGGVIFREDLTVAPNATGTFDLLVPVPTSSSVGSVNMTIGITGPGFDGSRMNNEFFGYFNSNHANPQSPFTIIGSQVLGVSGTGPLEESYKDVRRDFYGSEVDAANLPTDWRAYSGVAAFILKDSEWLSLNAAQREAVCNYVAQGGHLTLFSTGNPAGMAQLQLPGPDGKPGSYGFGTISVETNQKIPPDAGTLKTIIGQNSATAPENIDGNFSTWGLREKVGTIAVSGTFILTFVLLFGSLVGPVNLFVFTSGRNRFRLFWTTPLISILASLLLVISILVTDGLGGHGRRLIAFFSLPGANREAVIQEQVARTGVLFSNRWHNDQSYLITPVSQRALSDAVAPTGYRMYGRRPITENPDMFIQQENELSGNWFRSRAISGQYLQAVRPSRAALTVLNGPAFNAGSTAPVVLSSFPGELDRVFLLDSQFHYWTCEHLAPGIKQTCVSCTARDFSEFWNDACVGAGGKLRPLLSQAQNHAGYFYATGEPAPGDPLETLGEIRWLAPRGIFLGPWVAATSTENGP